MLAEERLQEIKQIVEQNGSVSIEVLKSRFGVSDMTIRRDLEKCQQLGYLQRCHGGGISMGKLKSEISVSDRKFCNTSTKEKIGAYCAGLVNTDSVVYLDAGTTTLEIAKAISDIPGITVFTNDIYIAAVLSERNVRVCLPGGYIQNSSGSMIGEMTTSALKDVHLDVSFIGAAAINSSFDSMTPTVEKVYLRRTVVGNSSRTYLVADSSKFGIQSVFKINSLTDYTAVVTDKSFSEEELIDLKSKNIEILNI